MRHWYWCSITRGDEEPDTNEERVKAICKAHGLEVKRQLGSNDLWLVLMPEFPESIEIAALEMGVGELTVSME